MRKRDLVLAVAAVVTAIALTVGIFAGGALETASWGLHFSGNTPTGPVSAGELARYDGFYIGDPGEKVIYLTFDAGYENGCTAEILDILKKHEVSAAFFLVGNYMEKNADLVRRMVEEGHIVGNHTMHHKDMASLSETEFLSELSALEELFRQVTDKELPKFYRPPQGVYSEENLKAAQKAGYKTVFWSLAYADWDNANQPSPESAMEKLTGRIHNGAVVLLHSTSKTNAQILDRLLTAWEDMGYRFGTLEELQG